MPVFPDEGSVAEVPAVNADATWHHVSVSGRRRLSKRRRFSFVVDGQIGEIKGRPVFATAIQPRVTGGDDRVSPSTEGRRGAAVGPRPAAIHRKGVRRNTVCARKHVGKGRP